MGKLQGRWIFHFMLSKHERNPIRVAGAYGETGSISGDRGRIILIMDLQRSSAFRNISTASTYTVATRLSSTTHLLSVYRVRRANIAYCKLKKTSLLCPICEDKKVVLQCGHETCQPCSELISHCPLFRLENPNEQP
ncbi:hypothetical protein PsorP6_008611 [Peronosclerospora sorghi]|uniref:Uncharacterized protein n=1 Tax=Peronosclerospora sorghi TaxID=230839 RepID=A0ACC0WAU4_9STRA|nr:hypothetical protein PsorP6_008611 [Peronosclerospora sorghi]